MLFHAGVYAWLACTRGTLRTCSPLQLIYVIISRMSTLYLMCGAPFSGKTTLAQILASKTQSQYLSLDDIMRQQGLDLSQAQPVEAWEKAHQICLQRMDALMREQVSIVLDDTNNLRWLRDRFRHLAQQHQYHVMIIFLDIPLVELEKRREHVFLSRERNFLPDEVFYAVVEHFEKPDKDEQVFMFDGTLGMNEWVEKNLV